ncbi:MAG: heat-inducible transcriptional repressor HrcA [Longicatena sp.]
MLTERQLGIFKTIVDEFTRSAEPVGSKTLMDLLDFTCSSATIRNEMAVLEEIGLLEKTHTSSGRIPSSKGYRFYVEHLMEHQLDDTVKNSLQAVFKERHYSMDEIVQKSCDILSQMTSLTSVVLGPESKCQTLQHIQLFPISERSAVAVFITDHGHTENKTFQFDTEVGVEDIKTCCALLNDKLSGIPISEVVEKMKEIQPLLASHVARHEVLFEAFVNAFMRFATEHVYCSGQSNMLYQPEFADIEKLKEIMKMLEDSSLFRQLANHEGDVAIEIGGDNELLAMNDVSVVSSKFKINEFEEGELMIVGPTRMQYSRIVSLMEYMSKVIEDMYKSERTDRRST